MVIDRDRKYREMAVRGKYRRLYTYLCGRPCKSRMEGLLQRD